jgi:hypothetical protein
VFVDLLLEVLALPQDPVNRVLLRADLVLVNLGEVGEAQWLVLTPPVPSLRFPAAHASAFASAGDAPHVCEVTYSMTEARVMKVRVPILTLARAPRFAIRQIVVRSMPPSRWAVSSWVSSRASDECCALMGVAIPASLRIRTVMRKRTELLPDELF